MIIRKNRAGDSQSKVFVESTTWKWLTYEALQELNRHHRRFRNGSDQAYCKEGGFSPRTLWSVARKSRNAPGRFSLEDTASPDTINLPSMNLYRFLHFSTLIVLTSCSEPSGTGPGGENPSSSPPGMVLIPGGPFHRGGDAGEMEGESASHQSAYPIHEVQVDAFWIDETEVTNRQFREFVEATGYVTFAERQVPEEERKALLAEAQRNLARLELFAKQATGADRQEILAAIEEIEETSKFVHLEGAVVFAVPEGDLSDTNDLSQWWSWVPGANWKAPNGPGSTLEGLDDHPVVNVTYEDAAAYAKWTGKRLPTEAEWEKAARGGLDRQPYVWGKEMFPEGENNWMANIWQGEWPRENTEADGFFATSPVKSFPANGYGLYDMAGNVWEIVSDLYLHGAYSLPSATVANSTGPSPEEYKATGVQEISRVTKGGSFLCSDVWCKGYQPGSREAIDEVSPSNHTGFRCATEAQEERRTE